MHLHHSVLDTIGNTPLVQLRRVVPEDCARILVKVEGRNPTGSMKDRMAQAVIEAAERDGRLKPGDTVVEYTGGSTGASLALICAAKGYPLRVFSSDAFSEEKLVQMAAFGAELTIIPSDDGRITKTADREHDRRRQGGKPRARHLLDRPAEQCRHDRRLSSHGPGNLGPERRAKWMPSFMRSAPALRSKESQTVLRRAQSECPDHRRRAERKSPVLSGGPPGAHKIDGIGIGYIPPLWDPDIVDESFPSPPPTRMRWRFA